MRTMLVLVGIVIGLNGLPAWAKPTTDVDVDTSIRNTNTVSQQQGQQQGQGQKQATTSVGSVEVKGDNVRSIAYGGLAPMPGTSTAQVQTLWGGASVSQTTRAQELTAEANALILLTQAGLLSVPDGKTQAEIIADRFNSINKPKRWLGLAWESDGCNLLNACGLLSWGSWRKGGK